MSLIRLTVLSQIQIQVISDFLLICAELMRCVDWSRQDQACLVKCLIKDDVLNTKYCKIYLEVLEDKVKRLKGSQQPK